MMRDAYSSAEDRIKRNIKNVQRNEAAYDRNFARKWSWIFCVCWILNLEKNYIYINEEKFFCT